MGRLSAKERFLSKTSRRSTPSRIGPRAIAITANAVMFAMTAADDRKDNVKTAEAVRPMIAGAIPATDAEMIAATVAAAPA